MSAAMLKPPIVNMQHSPVDYAALERHVAAAKAAWRQRATWEEKIASIEKMWARDKALKAAREALAFPVQST
jgi:hypothetical protein